MAEKVGLDDYLVKHGAKAFRDLVAEATSPESLISSRTTAEKAEKKRTPLENFDPEAEAFCYLLLRSGGGDRTLQYWNDSFWIYDAGRYIPLPDFELEAQVLAYLLRSYEKVKSRQAREVVEHIKAQTLLPSRKIPPFWIAQADGLEELDLTQCLATPNQILDIGALTQNRPSYVWRSTPKLFNLNALSFDFDPDAPEPTLWLQFLDSVWPNDPQCINTFQEIFGYLLTRDTSQQKMFMVVGPRRSGKGTAARVLRHVIGPDNVVGPTLSSLTERFGLAPLLDKSLAIVSDARISGRIDQVAVVERLLTITGEDAVSVDRKFLPAVTTKLGTRFVILTNELPRLTDASGAIVSRLVLLQMSQSFYGREDRSLTEKLLQESQGILLWAIEGWRRLHARGHFIQPDSSLESLAELNDLASPISAFVRECCVVDAAASVAVTELFEAWKMWSAEQGRDKYAGTVQSFGRELLAAVSGIRRHRPRGDGTRQRVYEGIGLRSA